MARTRNVMRSPAQSLLLNELMGDYYDQRLGHCVFSDAAAIMAAAYRALAFRGLTQRDQPAMLLEHVAECFDCKLLKRL